jgi:Rod binding domain-containing protein
MAAALAAGIGQAPFAATGIAAKPPTPAQAKARASAQEFEAVFLNAMFSQMFTGIGAEGPLGGGPAVGVWRSFLTDEYAKTFARAGGIGIADEVYRTLIAQQEAAGKRGV